MTSVRQVASLRAAPPSSLEVATPLGVSQPQPRALRITLVLASAQAIRCVDSEVTVVVTEVVSVAEQVETARLLEVVSVVEQVEIARPLALELVSLVEQVETARPLALELVSLVEQEETARPQAVTVALLNSLVATVATVEESLRKITVTVVVLSAASGLPTPEGSEH